MLYKDLQILTEAQFNENVTQFSHTAVLYLAQHVQRYELRKDLFGSSSGGLPWLSRRQPPKTFASLPDTLQSGVQPRDVAVPLY